MKILLVGGGSGGPVVPLLAVAKEIKKINPKASFLLVGTKKGPEKILAREAKIPFASIPAGKWRRYFSVWNFFTPMLVMLGFLKAFKILKKFKPDRIFGAGSFVQVPLIWAAWLMKIPVIIHQQDFLPSLANTLCQILAKKITVTFENSIKDFSAGLGFIYRKKKDKVIFTGNPFRESLKTASKEKSLRSFGLTKNFPTLLVLGGGTGAEFMNKLIKNSMKELTKVVQVVHVTGNRKFSVEKMENYKPYKFLTNMAEAYAVADLVLSRAGLSTITELSNLKKVSIVVPMPKSHQEVNAFLLMNSKAAIVIPQRRLKPFGLVKLIRRLIFEHDLTEQLKKNIGNIMPGNAGSKIAKVILEEF